MSLAVRATKRGDSPSRLPRTVGELMTAPAICVDVEDRLDVALAVMEHAKVRHLPVVSQGRLRGVLSHRDVLSASERAGDAGAHSRQRHAITVGALMSSAPLVTHESESIGAAAERMLEERISCLPILDGDPGHPGGEVIGILTTSDLLRLSTRMLDARVTGGEHPVAVGQLMTPGPVIAVGPDDTLATAAQILASASCRHLAVVENEQLLGMLSDRDLLAARGAVDLRQERCRAHMATPPWVVPPTLEAARAAELLLERGVHAMPVADERGVVGMLSEVDFLAYVATTAPSAPGRNV